AAAAAGTRGIPLLSFVRSGGTRLQEGMAALVGIPRAALALDSLAAAGVAHLAIADHPTTGGVWVAIVSRADLRIGAAGATVGFSGPEVAAAMTGIAIPSASHTAESAQAAGLLDEVLPGPLIGDWLGRVLAALCPRAAPTPASARAPERAPERAPGVASRPASDRSPGGDIEAAHSVDAWEHIHASRTVERLGGGALLALVVDEPVDLSGGDEAVRAVVGRSALGRPAVGVALAARRGARPGPRGYRLLARAAQLADRLGLDLVTLIDTPGADPGTASEASGVAPEIAHAMAAVLACRSPVLAVVHGEGGSGGALAAAVGDAVLVGPHGYFAALGPEGAARALHRSPQEAARLMRPAPADLLELGFADAGCPADPEDLRDMLARRLADLGAIETKARLAGRHARWSGALPGYGQLGHPELPAPP
ncbi:MAG TPA: carboxyl transferase domain-containing protein, partial [Mycobacteriales bacterium]|nr:carboxyl transferase domain-containing protein [Mycobacteriales bacterium]